MIVYKVFSKNYGLRKGEFVGMLIERRKNLRGMTQTQSGLRWAKLTLALRVKDKQAIFVVPDKLNLGNDTKWLMEKGVFTKEEFLVMAKLVEQ